MHEIEAVGCYSCHGAGWIHIPDPHPRKNEEGVTVHHNYQATCWVCLGTGRRIVRTEATYSFGGVQDSWEVV